MYTPTRPLWGLAIPTSTILAVVVLFILLFVGLLFISGCDTQAVFSERETLNASLVEEAGDEVPGLGSENGERSLTVKATTPYCCDALERIFEIEFNNATLPVSAQCEWEFSDGYGARGCHAVRHSFPWPDRYTATLTLTLPNAENIITTLEIIISEHARPEDGNREGENEVTLVPVSDDDENDVEVLGEEESGDEEEEQQEVEVVSLQIEAMDDLEVFPSQHVPLNVVTSVDPSTALVTYTWRQVDGPRVTIENETSPHASFIAPVVDEETAFEFEVTASAGELMATDLVTIFITLVSSTARLDDPRWNVDPADATDAIQRAIDSDAERVIIPNTGEPWIVQPLTLRSNLHLVLEPGVVLEAKAGAYQGKNDSMLSIKDVHDVTVEGYGATLRMRKEDYVSYVVKSEWRHGICIQGAKNVEVRGLRIEQTGGDGIYVGMTSHGRRIPSQNVTVRDCTIQSAYRNGISITSAENLLVENCTIKDTQGTPPQAAIDLEPNSSRDKLTNVQIRNCVAEANKGSAYIVSINRFDLTTDEMSVYFTNCRSSGSYNAGFRLINGPGEAPEGLVEFRNCQTETIFYSGIRGTWNMSAPLKVRFVDSVWRNVAQNKNVAPIYFELTKDGPSPGGGIEFINCRIYDEIVREPFEIREDGSVGPYDITGDIDVINSQAGRSESVPATECPELTIHHHISE